MAYLASRGLRPGKCTACCDVQDSPRQNYLAPECLRMCRRPMSVSGIISPQPPGLPSASLAVSGVSVAITVCCSFSFCLSESSHFLFLFKGWFYRILGWRCFSSQHFKHIAPLPSAFQCFQWNQPLKKIIVLWNAYSLIAFKSFSLYFAFSSLMMTKCGFLCIYPASVNHFLGIWIDLFHQIGIFWPLILQMFFFHYLFFLLDSKYLYLRLLDIDYLILILHFRGIPLMFLESLFSSTVWIISIDCFSGSPIPSASSNLSSSIDCLFFHMA